MRGRHYPKLAKQYFGPWRVQWQIGMVAYELVLPPGSKVHPVFHISKLKPHHGHPPSQINPLPPSLLGTSLVLQPLKILGKRTLLALEGHQQQYLVQWDRLSDREATWVSETSLKTLP